MNNLSTKLLACLLSAGVIALNACNDGSLTSSDKTQSADTMNKNKSLSISQEKYGTVDGQEVIQYTLTNPAGMIVKIINYGGTITQLLVPDSTGKWGDVVLGFESLPGYLQANNPYFGCLVGRYANRIANGKFTLNGKTHQLPLNNNGNSLHGGIKGLSKVVWAATPLPGDSSLKLTYTCKDGDEGYPGNLSVQVVYTVTPSNELKIVYTANTDKGTPINLTNHTYFNLSAGRDTTVLGHQVYINADKYVVVNENLIPTGELAAVKGGAMDFNIPAKVGTDIQKVAGGYDHCWVLNKKTPKALEL
ncbi:MAG: aldose epimerase family protein, partial [Flavitalea sp.]